MKKKETENLNFSPSLTYRDSDCLEETRPVVMRRGDRGQTCRGERPHWNQGLADQSRGERLDRSRADNLHLEISV